MKTAHFLFGIALMAACASAASAQDEQLAIKARDIFAKHCMDCHGDTQLIFNLNFSQHATVIYKDTKYVVPKDLEASKVWKAIESGKMPKDSPKMPAQEIAVIKEWIEKGAPEWPIVVEPRPFVSDIDVLNAIRDDLRKANAPDRPFRRYFSIANLHNNWSGKRIGKSNPVDPRTLLLAKAALSKAANSMSFENQIALPEVVSKNGVVLRIDLRDFGWDKADQWRDVLRKYPYGLKYNLHRDQNVRQLAEEVTELSGTELPCVRLDWFVDTATRPQLYAKMLQLPGKVQELEKLLKVDVVSDFERDRLARAGFSESGVSKSNRLVDRHPAAFGAYWKSYDFAKSEGRGNLFQFPLGPDYDGSQFSRQAFQHDGGEMIFNLPNGLQAYYLSDAKGTPLTDGPINVVRDKNEVGGSPVVINGLSCMACHANGMQRFKDTVRTGLAVEGAARLKVDRLFRTADEMNKLLDQDETRFLDAAARAMGPYLNSEDPKSVNPRNYAEPVGQVALAYQRDVTIEEAAAELGMESAEKLKILIENNSRLRTLGLGPLAAGAAIKREAWSSSTGFLSTFQKVASELDIGTPHKEI